MHICIGTMIICRQYHMQFQKRGEGWVGLQ